MNQFDIKELFIKNIKDSTTLNIALALVEEWSDYKHKIDKIENLLYEEQNSEPSELSGLVSIDDINKILEEIDE